MVVNRAKDIALQEEAFNFPKKVADHFVLKNAEILHTLPCREIREHLFSFEKSYESKNASSDFTSSLYDHLARDTFIFKYGFSIPCLEAIEAIRLHLSSNVLDPMSGTGFWMKVLSQSGFQVIAADKRKIEKNSWLFEKSHWPIRRMSATRSIRRYPNHDIFLSWPPYATSDGASVLKLMQPGRTLALIGEGSGGCTGDSEMFDFLNHNFEHLEEVSIPQFSGIRDYLSIHRKK